MAPKQLNTVSSVSRRVDVKLGHLRKDCEIFVNLGLKIYSLVKVGLVS